MVRKPISVFKLIFFFIGIAGLIIIFGLNFYYRQQEVIKKEKYEELSAIASLKASQVFNYRNERVSDAKVISENEFLAVELNRYITNPENTTLKNRIVKYLRLIMENYRYKGVLIFDTIGKISLAVGYKLPSIGQDTYTFIRESMNKKSVTMSEIYYCDMCSDIHLDIFAPIYVEEKLNGGMVFRIDPEEFLFPLIQSWPTLSKTSESLLIKKDANEVVFINKLRHEENTVLKLKLKIDSSNINIPAVAATYGIEGYKEGIDYRGVPVLSNIRKIPDTPWWMIVKVDLSEVHSATKEKAIYIGLLIGMLTLIFALGFFWLWTNQKKTIRFLEAETKFELQERVIAEQKRAAEALRMKNWVFDVSTVANSISDTNGLITEANESFLQIWGYKNKKEIIGEPLFNFIQKKNVALEIMATLNLRGQWEGVFTAIKKDGSTFIAQSQASIVKDDKGDVIGYQSMVLDITMRKEREDEINKINAELEQRVAERTLELENSTLELENVQAALLNIVEDLNEKTQELALSAELLKYTNKELESFSYTVSHDLRAPLRALDGFAKILLEDYSSTLDSDGKRYLNIIVENAINMGQLIDDLLTFSRLGRHELEFTEINMFDLAKLIFEESLQQSRNPNAELKIKPLPDAFGDFTMVKQVWRNLIGNAIKYGPKNDKLILEIGNKTIDAENVYYIKDNGVGFDMAYKDKLFGVFQRLHSSKEFEGTGVGLAIVQRIIHRLGGKVWAEGEVNKGATFYFTLQKHN